MFYRISHLFVNFKLTYFCSIIENGKALRDIFRNALLSSVSLMTVAFVNVKNITFVDGLTVTFLQSILLFAVFLQVDVLVALGGKLLWYLYLLALLLRTILEIIFWGDGNTPSPLLCRNGVASTVINGREISRVIDVVFLWAILLIAVPFSIQARFHGPRRSRNPYRIIIVPATIIGFVLQIIMIEVIIGTNDSTSRMANTWTHGQILSLVLVVNNIVDVVSAFKSGRRDFHLVRESFAYLISC
jgi:hypothetical protein